MWQCHGTSQFSLLSEPLDVVCMLYMLACSCIYQRVCLHTANTIAFFTWLHRWKGGWDIRLEGSDHAPVLQVWRKSMIFPHIALCLYLLDIYLPMIHGVQQTPGMTICVLDYCPCINLKSLTLCSDLVNDKAGCYMTSILQDIKFIFRWRCYCTGMQLKH